MASLFNKYTTLANDVLQCQKTENGSCDSFKRATCYTTGLLSLLTEAEIDAAKGTRKTRQIVDIVSHQKMVQYAIISAIVVLGIALVVILFLSIYISWMSMRLKKSSVTLNSLTQAFVSRRK